MCPACLTAAAILAAKVTSAGGLAVYAATKLRARVTSSLSTPPVAQEMYEQDKNRVR